METSIFVAQLAAIIYLSVGVGMLVSPDHYKKLFDSLSKDIGAMYVGGFMAMVAGFSLVTYHNVWVQEWPILITLIGWLALAKGFLILAFPKLMQRMSQSIVHSKSIGLFSVLAILVGLVFVYFGYII